MVTTLRRRLETMGWGPAVLAPCLLIGGLAAAVSWTATMAIEATDETVATSRIVTSAIRPTGPEERAVGLAEERLEAVEQRLWEARREATAARIARARIAAGESGQVAGSLQMTRDPGFGHLFNLRVQLDETSRDRARLESLLDDHRDTGRAIPVDALEIIPAAAQSSELSRVVESLLRTRAELRALRTSAPSAVHRIERLSEQARTVEMRAIPDIVEAITRELAHQQRSLQRAIDDAAAGLETLPPATAHERRLEERARALEARYAEAVRDVQAARRAAAAPTVELRILDYATVQADPSSRLRIPMTVLAFCVCFGVTLAVGGALREGWRPDGADLLPLVAIVGGGVLAVLMSVRLF